MKRTTVVLSCLLCAFLLTHCADPTEGKPDAVVGDAIAIEADAPEVQETEVAEAMKEGEDPFSQPAEGSRAKETEVDGTVYVMEENSGIQFEGSKVTGSHVGGFASYDGMVVVPEGGEIEDIKIEVSIDMTSVFSDAGGLTEKLRGPEFFDVEQFPAASFKSTSIAKTDDGYNVTGNFDLHGVTKSITFPAKISVAEDKLTASAEFVIKQFDWGIKYRGLGQDMIRDEVLILLDILAKPEAA
jgi:polyisoprenoid-binding protein YceI